MAVQRSKAASTFGNVNIHTLVQNWYQDAQVWYVAHAFLNNGSIVCLRPAISAAASNSPASHPDQSYWRTLVLNQAPRAVQAITNSVGAIQGNIARIDIDCKLMPCNSQYTGCLYQVPAFMVNFYGLNGIAVRMFSHADENMGGNGTGHLSSKRVVSCTTGAAPRSVVSCAHGSSIDSVGAAFGQWVSSTCSFCRLTRGGLSTVFGATTASPGATTLR